MITNTKKALSPYIIISAVTKPNQITWYIHFLVIVFLGVPCLQAKQPTHTSIHTMQIVEATQIQNKSGQTTLSSSQPKEHNMIIFETSHGEIHIELHPDTAPISSANFIEYVQEGFYDGVIFHRVIPNFMIQSGGFTSDMKQKKTRDPIKNEANNGLKNTRGSIAMARTQIVDSATAQFFINLQDNDFLNHNERDFGYAVFGKVIEGMDVVDAIAKVQTGNTAGHQDVPIEPVVIHKARIVEKHEYNNE